MNTQVSNSSRYNDFFLIHAINLAHELLQKFPNVRIAYLTAYTAQTRLATIARIKMIAQDVDGALNVKSRFSVRTGDSAQGFDFEIVLIDILILEGAGRRLSAGFSDNANRLNVALSRAMKGTYVLGSKHPINEMYEKLKWLNEFHSALFRNRHYIQYERSMPFCDFYRPGRN